MKSLLLSFLLPFCILSTTAQDAPIELGTVQWLRNYDSAIHESKASGKPVLILFQEVPGCHTCTTYGKNVLSHPLLVEIMEDSFVPLAIFNNKGGHDREILAKFGEPTWNNPVVRIIDAKGKDIIPRINGRYTKEALLEGMLSALEQSNVIIPDWMRLLQEELDPGRPLKKATFSMGCFWSGEGQLGQIQGVHRTRAGWMKGREVVEVHYDPSIINFQNLLKAAKDKGVANAVFSDHPKEVSIAKNTGTSVQDPGKFRDDRAPKYYTSQTLYQFLPMTEVQASRVNSALGKHQDPKTFLSPRQIKILEEIVRRDGEGYTSSIQKDFVASMKELPKTE